MHNGRPSETASHIPKFSPQPWNVAATPEKRYGDYETQCLADEEPDADCGVRSR